MAIYTVESDKIFLRSMGDGVVEVKEIENLNISLIQEKHWTVHPTIRLGRRKEYQSLLIGDTEIRSRDLTTLLTDLCDSRLMVNREGRCILPTTGIVNEEFEVGYYRMFDLFEWSKYGVKAMLNTRWSRMGVLSGRSMLATTPSKDSSKKVSITDIMLEETKLKLESSTWRNVELERELNVRKSDLVTSDYYRGLLELGRTRSRMNVKIDGTVTGSRKWNTSLVPTAASPFSVFLTEKAVASLAPELRVSSNADAENWWAVYVVGKYRSGLRKESFNGVFVYYDGNFGYHKFEQLDTMPIPVRDGVPFHLTNETTLFLRGLGPRYGSFFVDADA